MRLTRSLALHCFTQCSETYTSVGLILLHTLQRDLHVCWPYIASHTAVRLTRLLALHCSTSHNETYKLLGLTLLHTMQRGLRVCWPYIAPHLTMRLTRLLALYCFTHCSETDVCWPYIASHITVRLTRSLALHCFTHNSVTRLLALYCFRYYRKAERRGFLVSAHQCTQCFHPHYGPGVSSALIELSIRFSGVERGQRVRPKASLWDPQHLATLRGFTFCGAVNVQSCFRGTYCFYLQGGKGNVSRVPTDVPCSRGSLFDPESGSCPLLR
jgi:hypothetical protein